MGEVSSYSTPWLLLGPACSLSCCRGLLPVEALELQMCVAARAGKWTVQQAAELSTAAPTITASLDGRYMSAIKPERVAAAKVSNHAWIHSGWRSGGICCHEVWYGREMQVLAQPKTFTLPSQMLSFVC